MEREILYKHTRVKRNNGKQRTIPPSDAYLKLVVSEASPNSITAEGSTHNLNILTLLQMAHSANCIPAI